MKKIFAKQVEAFLRKSDRHYIHTYFFECTMYDDEGNDCGTFSQKVLGNLLLKGIICYCGNDDQFWSEGYYRLTEHTKPSIF